MSFDFVKYAADAGIPTISEGHRHCRPGWVQTECPFCSGNPGYHLGYNIAGDYFNCYRCGGHLPIDVIARLGRMDKSAARRALAQYKGKARIRQDAAALSAVKLRRSCKWPHGVGPLKRMHKRYLQGRDFDPEKLIRTWNLEATGCTGDYKFRILAPITFEGKVVSFQGLDVTDLASLHYKTCAEKNEARKHKHCLYGAEHTGKDAVIVEGIADTWRLGPGAAATFGIGYTQTQVQLISKYRRRFLLFDSGDVQAILQAEKLGHALSVFPGETELIEIEWDDPGEMPQDEADTLMKELLG